MDKILIENSNLNEYLKKCNISKRAFNVLKYNDLLSFEKLSRFIQSQRSFLSLKNAGQKTLKELNLLVATINSDYEQIDFKKINNFTKKNKRQIIFSSKDYEFIPHDIDNYFLKQYIYLNLLRLPKFLNKDILDKLKKMNIKDFHSYLVSIDFLSIKSIGIGKVDKYNLFVAHISKIYLSSIIIDNYFESKDFKIEVINYILNAQILNSSNIDEYIDKSSGKVYFFKIVDLLLTSENNRKDVYIFRTLFRIYNNEKYLNMSTIGSKINLSGERIRQLSYELSDDFQLIFELILFGFGRNNIYFENYLKIDNFKGTIDYKLLNTTENTDFSNEFIYNVFNLIVKDNFRFFVVERDKKSVNFLIDKKYFKIDFNKILMMFDFKALNTDYFKYKLNLKDLVRETTDPKLLKDEEFMKLLQSIIEFYLDGQTNSNLDVDYIKKYRYNYEYVLETLYYEGRPMYIEELYFKIKEKYPNIIKSIVSLRGNIQTCKYLIYFGRSSMYGLAEWENKFSIKGGTIRSIVAEYLADKDEPVHISEIEAHVKQFRKTKAITILGNLKIEKSKTFTFYNSGYVGLASKHNHIPKDYYNKLNLNRFRFSFNGKFEGAKSTLKYDEMISEIAKINKVTETQIKSIVDNRILNNRLVVDDEGYLIKI